ncbi:MAG: adaptor protein MecA [Ruminococcaceae bacterium]|nr:adaptor protein MecA [Oscillospiraceae bacterium]
MELIKITDQKLKIMLTPSDITLYELNDNEPLTQNHPNAIRRLLCEVRRQLGLDFDDSHISIRYFPSKGGGGEMFVCGAPSKNSEERRRASSARNASLPQASEKAVFSGFRWEGAYRFEALSHLLSACARLQEVDYVGESAVYRDHCSYFLLLRTYARAPFAIPDELTFLSEYGSVENVTHLRLYIKEHGTLIRSPDAVSVLAQLK